MCNWKQKYKHHLGEKNAVKETFEFLHAKSLLLRSRISTKRHLVWLQNLVKRISIEDFPCLAS
jgi:hypothetical protein